MGHDGVKKYSWQQYDCIQVDYQVANCTPLDLFLDHADQGEQDRHAGDGQNKEQPGKQWQKHEPVAMLAICPLVMNDQADLNKSNGNCDCQRYD